MLQLFFQPHQFVLSVKPNSYQIISLKVTSESLQKHNAGIASVEFLGVDNDTINAKDYLLNTSEKEGFWFYFSNFHVGGEFKKVIKIPSDCYAIKLKLKKWKSEGGVFVDGNVGIEYLPANTYQQFFGNLVANRIDNKESEVIRSKCLWLDNKKNAYKFSRRYNISPPKIYGEFNSMEAIDFSDHPENFVLKPLWGHSSKGVFVLRKTSDKEWFDSMRKKTFTKDQILQQLKNELLGKAERSAYFTEEMMEDANGVEIPMDYKVYSFYGKVGLIMQKYVGVSNDRSTWRFKFYDADWNDLGPVKYHNLIDSELPKPEIADEIVEAAEKLSLESKVPFLRIDFYATRNGLRFGEFTPMPGGFDEHDVDTDMKLGDMWISALDKIKDAS